MEKMLKLNLTTFLFCFFLLFLLTGASRHHHHVHRRHNHRGLGGSRPTKLFVFGDSYADTGNNNVSTGASWKAPYGTTFPGTPAGRFSDGRVLTDFVAKFLGLNTPLAYQFWKKSMGIQYLPNGMNFAYGGSGVFETLATYPNMTAQIGFYKELLNKSVLTQPDVQCSVALVTLSGNDYNAYMQRNGSPQGYQSFIASVVNQLATNLKMIGDSGVKKIAVAGLQPLGCVPPFTATDSGLQCNATLNALVGFHNQLLEKAVATLNNETDGSKYIILDLYTSFMDVLNSTTTGGSTKFENPLKQCCAGTSTSSSCGDVDDNGVKQYTVCDNPESAFFWDNFHPTQAGWSYVYGTLQTTLQKLVE